MRRFVARFLLRARYSTCMPRTPKEVKEREAPETWPLKGIWEVVKSCSGFRGNDLRAREFTASKLVFTGREGEMQKVRDAASSALDFQETKPPFVALEGISGSGKSRMLREAPFRAGVPIHPLKENGVLTLTLDFNGTGDLPRKSDLDILKSGQTFLSLSILCRVFFGCSLSKAMDSLLQVQDRFDCLQHLDFSQVMQMVLYWHRTMYDIADSHVLLVFLLLDEMQLIAPYLQQHLGFDKASAVAFVDEICEAMYAYRVFEGRVQNCALLPLCAGTLIRELGARRLSFSITPYGKDSIFLLGLQVETGIQLLSRSLDHNYEKFLKTEAVKTLLIDVMVLPRFLEFVYIALSRDYILEDICGSKFERVMSTVRALVRDRVQGMFDGVANSQWQTIVYYCITMMPVKIEDLAVHDAAFRGYISMTKIEGGRYVISMPFVLLQLFWSELGLPSLLDWFGPPVGKGDGLENNVQEMIAIRMRLLQLSGRAEIRLDELLVGAEGKESTLGLKIKVDKTLKIVMKNDQEQFVTRKGTARNLESVLGTIYKACKNTMGIDLRLPLGGVKLCVFQAKGWSQAIPYVGESMKDPGEPAKHSVYKICEKMELERKFNWIGVVVLTGPVSGSLADKELLFSKFPNLALLSGDKLKQFFPRA